MTEEITLTPNRPYLARAIYEWIVDNNLVPHILVDATQKNVIVPREFVKNGQIVLNVAPYATHNFELGNDVISFSARFGGVSQDLYIPISALLGIYARENGVGLFFDPSEYDLPSEENESVETTTPATETEDTPPKKSRFKLVD